MTSVSKYSSRNSAIDIVQKRSVSAISAALIPPNFFARYINSEISRGLKLVGSGAVRIKSGWMKRHRRVTSRA